MKVNTFDIKGVIEFLPRVFGDDRGFFFESYSEKVFEEYLPGIHFVQDNQSLSSKGTLRGLHFQKAPYAQGKLVRVITGSALDVVVDIRKDSPTFGQHLTFKLNTNEHNMVYVPEGFAHGFAALEDNTTFVYKCTNYYHKESESGIVWNDPELNIDWGVKNPIISEKDLILPSFNSLK